MPRRRGSRGVLLRAFASRGSREALRIDTPGGPVIGMAGPDGAPHPSGAPPGPHGVVFRDPDDDDVEAVHHAPPAG